jgi:hypothetical protein
MQALCINWCRLCKLLLGVVGSAPSQSNPPDSMRLQGRCARALAWPLPPPPLRWGAQGGTTTLLGQQQRRPAAARPLGGTAC